MPVSGCERSELWHSALHTVVLRALLNAEELVPFPTQTALTFCKSHGNIVGCTLVVCTRG